MKEKKFQTTLVVLDIIILALALVVIGTNIYLYIATDAAWNLISMILWSIIVGFYTYSFIRDIRKSKRIKQN